MKTQKTKFKALHDARSLLALSILLGAFFLFAGAGKASAATNVYYSVGQNTDDHKTGSPTITLSGYAATLSVGQTAPNMGVGDLINYAGGSCFISAKTDDDQMHWNCQNAMGGTAPQVTDASVTSITHAFSSLSAAVGGASPGAANSSHLNTSNLTSGDYVLNIPCYYDTGADTTAVTISGWTTGASNYMHIYTPTSTTTEVNQTQRHSGVWDDTKYRLVRTNGTTLDIRIAYIKVDGLQFTNTQNGSGQNLITFENGTYIVGQNWAYISNNIIKGSGNASYAQKGISGWNNHTEYIWNCILYNISSVSSDSRVIVSKSSSYVYNTTVIGGYYGIVLSGGTMIVKNTYAGGSTNGDYYGSPTLTNSASSDTSGSTGLQGITVNTTTFSNVSSGTEDYRLPGTGSALYNAGTNTSGDSAPLNFTIDIKNTARPSGGSWDIGADEYEIPTDTEDPVVTDFDIPPTATSRNISISTFEATDNVSVTGYLITESATEPDVNDAGWSSPPPSTYTITGTGTSHTLYAWAKDAYGNISASQNDSVVVSLTAASCSYADVSDEVSIAVDGDTILVPAGTCIWDAPLTITKAIVLQGGVGGTTEVTSNYTSVGYTGMFNYVPATPSTSHRFRLTGFTFNNDGKCYFFRAYQATSTPETIRVDHNVITMSGSYRAFYTIGSFYGVVDSNTVTATGGASIAKSEGNDDVVVSDRKQWGILPRDYGTAENLYYEDNVFSLDSGIMISSGTGGRYLFRYNTLTATTTSQMGEMHGNQPAGAYETSLGGNSATMIVEMYANSFQKMNSYFNVLYDQRGGKSLFFLNRIINTANNQDTSLRVREEYSDDLWPSGNTEIMRATDSYSWGNWQNKSVDTTLLPMTIDTVENCCTDDPVDWQPNTLYGAASTASDLVCHRWVNDPNDHCWKRSQHGDAQVSPYLTGNTEPDWSGTAERYTLRDGDINWLNMGTGTPITENVDFWTQKSGSFDGTGNSSAGGGVGCGTLASRPSTCTTGVAYWASGQSCTDLSGMVGANPTTPISGTLYKCTSTDTWEAYYTPYTYPHTLRGDSEAVPPQMTAFSIPETATSLTVSIAEFTATDDTAVTGYLLTESAVTPDVDDPDWSGTAQTEYTFSTEGAKTLYAWAKDAAGNVSTSLNDSISITLPTYTIGGTISGLTGTAVLQNNGGDDLTITSNGSFTFGTALHHSDTYSVIVSDQPDEQTCTVTNGTGTVSGANVTNISVTCEDGADSTPPTVAAFSIPLTSDSLTIAITEFTATDDTAVTGYLLTESSSTPSPGDSGWEVSAQDEYIFSSEGAKTLYAWAKDGSGNISESLNASVAVVLNAQVAGASTKKKDHKRDLDVHSVKFSPSATTITVKWKTDYKANSKVKYGYTKEPKIKEKSSKRKKSHSITIKNLLPDRVYYFKASSTDEYGNEDKSKVYMVRTAKLWQWPR